MRQAPSRSGPPVGGPDIPGTRQRPRRSGGQGALTAAPTAGFSKSQSQNFCLRKSCCGRWAVNDVRKEDLIAKHALQGMGESEVALNHEGQEGKLLQRSDWTCSICLELLHKPCVNICGHVCCRLRVRFVPAALLDMLTGRPPKAPGPPSAICDKNHKNPIPIHCELLRAPDLRAPN